MEDVSVRVRSVEPVGEDVVAITFESPPDFDGEPGQFVRLSATVDGNIVQRFYTLSSPDTTETFEVTVAIDPEGSLGPWLGNRDPGDTIDLSGPYGDHFYEGEEGVVVIAAGPGIGPAIAIGERTIREGGTAALVYPVTLDVHADRLDELADAGVDLMTFEDDLDDAVSRATSAVDGTAFVYGFESFVSDAVRALESVGIDASDVKIESFGPGPES
ncbi:MAG: FAD-dependent oxidoreductase [Halanaeroarchaeum sp.]